MTSIVIYRLQAFSNTIRRTFVQDFTRFQLTACSHGSCASAELFVSLIYIRDLVTVFDSCMTPKLYADDLKLYEPYMFLLMVVDPLGTGGHVPPKFGLGVANGFVPPKLSNFLNYYHIVATIRGE